MENHVGRGRAEQAGHPIADVARQERESFFLKLTYRPHTANRSPGQLFLGRKLFLAGSQADWGEPETSFSGRIRPTSIIRDANNPTAGILSFTFLLGRYPSSFQTPTMPVSPESIAFDSSP